MDNDSHQHAVLVEVATRAMTERGLLPDFSPEAIAELDQIKRPAPVNGGQVRDLRSLLWCSIDNDESLDLDQLTVAEAMDGGRVKILVAIADVDALVKKGSAIDDHACQNTTTVYTPAVDFPMLPDKLSKDFTSLKYDEDRLAIVVEMVIEADGSLSDSNVSRAAVHNRAKLAYSRTAPWLEGAGDIPKEVASVPGLADNIRLQDQVAQQMNKFRHAHGALTFETVEARPVVKGGEKVNLQEEGKNRASEMIENFMIAANSVTARYLSSKNSPSIRRVVLAPQRWDRIVQVAGEHGTKLPDTPDSVALEQFLLKERAADPEHFPQLSLTIMKLIGPGEYAAELPSDTVPDHFSLAARDYTHSTAPNRRFSDLVTQRLLKSAMVGQPSPYSFNELVDLAAHCTQEEDVANKVERQVNKSAAALLIQSRIGDQFDAIVTGASPKGTWVRLLRMPVEGRLEHGYEGLDVGDRVHVQLISVNVEKGFIDFNRVH